MNIIAIANQKGGVAKTTTTHTLGTQFSRMGYRVLIVDLDPQSSLTNASGVESAANESMAEVIGDGQGATEKIKNILVDISEIEDTVLHLAPCDIKLSHNMRSFSGRRNRETVLKKALATIASNYDVCLLDCPPDAGMITDNALTAAHSVIIPTMPQVIDLRGLNLFIETINQAKKEMNGSLTVLGVLITFYDARLIHHKDAVQEIKNSELPVLSTMIGRSIKVAEAAIIGETILTYDPSNKQASQYKLLALEIDKWLKSGLK